ncbi:hypothetical protein [Paenibacillus sp. FSL K6-1230]|uniref:hypothetical protein n=1 Tax=Paenibacillus sp. FSL K6-1230 TaxID=2921603 RepID=UPI0030FB3DE0
MTTLDNGFMTPEEVAQSLLFSEVQRGRIGDTIHLVAADLELTKEYFKDVSAHYVIQADTIHLCENLVVAGRNITMNARIIWSDCPITIDTSYTSRPVEDYENNPARSGTAKEEKGMNGEHGANGKDGGQGIAGGHIVLVAERYELGGELKLIASGGPGGRGQDGGEGAVGTDGVEGKDIEFNAKRRYLFGAAPGKKGGNGGNGGNAGRSGNGGNGGDIFVGYVKSASEHLITLDSAAGQPGAEAEPGKGNSGGKGGIGAHELEFVVFPPTFVQSDKRGDSGADGIDGQDGARAVPASPGKAGQLAKMLIKHAQFHGSPIEHVSIQEEFITFYQNGMLCASLEQQTLTLHKASVAYMAGSKDTLNEAAVLLEWLINTLPDEEWFDKMRASQVQTTAFMKLFLTSSVQWLALRSKAIILLAQLGDGLDYFGNPWNWTPLMPLKEYQQRGSDLITAAKQAEDLYIEYMQAQNSQHNREGALTKALTISADKVVAMDKERAKSIADRSELKNDIDSMLGNLFEKEKILETTAGEFVEALRNQLALDSLKATFNLVVNGVALVTSVTPVMTAVRTGGAIYSAVSSCFESKASVAVRNHSTDPEQVEKEKKKQEEALSKSINSVKKGFSSIYGLYQSGRELRDIGEQMGQAQDKFGYRASMFKMTRKEFESMLEPVYKKVPAEKVESYRNAFYDYLKVVEGYQEKVQSYGAKFLEEEKLLADATRLRAEDERLRQALGDQVDPSLPLFHTYIFSMYNDAKQSLIDFLYQEYQAFRYMVLGHDLFPQIRGSHVAELSQIHATITNKIIDAVNHSETPIQTYRNITVIFNEATYPEQFRALREHKQAFFALSLDNKIVREKIAGKAHMTASQCQVQLPGARLDSGNVHVRFTHMGSSTFLDPQGERFDFVHKKSQGFYEYQVSITPAVPQGVTEKIESYSGGSAGDGLGRIMPGLLALWSIEIPLEDLNNDPLNRGVDLKDVNKIVMTFDGTAVAYTGRKSVKSNSNLEELALKGKAIPVVEDHEMYVAGAAAAPEYEVSEAIIIEL